MKDIKKPIQPYYLPQITASYKFITSNLDDFGIQYQPILIGAGQVKGIQKEVDLSKIKSIGQVDDEKLQPIWVSNDLKILDGHHRTSAKIYKEGKNSKIKAIRIDADERDGAAYLKVIQDRWEQLHGKN